MYTNVDNVYFCDSWLCFWTCNLFCPIEYGQSHTVPILKQNFKKAYMFSVALCTSAITYERPCQTSPLVLEAGHWEHSCINHVTPAEPSLSILTNPPKRHLLDDVSRPNHQLCLLQSEVLCITNHVFYILIQQNNNNTWAFLLNFNKEVSRLPMSLSWDAFTEGIMKYTWGSGPIIKWTLLNQYLIFHTYWSSPHERLWLGDRTIKRINYWVKI